MGSDIISQWTSQAGGSVNLNGSVTNSVTARGGTVTGALGIDSSTASVSGIVAAPVTVSNDNSAMVNGTAASTVAVGAGSTLGGSAANMALDGKLLNGLRTSKGAQVLLRPYGGQQSIVIPISTKGITEGLAALKS